MKSSNVLLWWICLLTAPWALAQMRYSYSSDGSEVTDAQTGLVWRRCAEGMAWSGSTCTGSAATYSHEGALARAQSQSGWRLPSVKELASIAERGRSNPAIDSAAFPATPSTRFWSSTPFVGYPADAWVVNFRDGHVIKYGRDYGYYAVRLVR